MKAINRKLGKLENCVLDTSNLDLSSTKIAYECLSEAEQKIMDKSHDIAKYWHEGDELTEAQRTLLEKAGQIMTARIGWLFGFNMSAILCRGDGFAEFMFYTRLFWFIDEMTDFLRQYHEEQAIFDQKGKTWKQKEEEADELYKTWKHPFSEESYEEFLRPVLNRMLKDLEANK